MARERKGMRRRSRHLSEHRALPPWCVAAGGAGRGRFPRVQGNTKGSSVSTAEEVIDVEAHEVGTDLEVRPSGEITLFRTDDPNEIVTKATEIATVLAQVLKKQKLTATISGREHVLVEGWTFCGTMLGVFPVCTWT